MSTELIVSWPPRLDRCECVLQWNSSAALLVQAKNWNNNSWDLSWRTLTLCYKFHQCDVASEHSITSSDSESPSEQVNRCYPIAFRYFFNISSNKLLASMGIDEYVPSVSLLLVGIHLILCCRRRFGRQPQRPLRPADIFPLNWKKKKKIIAAPFSWAGGVITARHDVLGIIDPACPRHRLIDTSSFLLGRLSTGKAFNNVTSSSSDGSSFFSFCSKRDEAAWQGCISPPPQP